jgi:hypothetical protein
VESGPTRRANAPPRTHSRRNALFGATWLRAGNRSPHDIYIRWRGRHQTSSAATADLTALAASRSRFFGCPLVRGTLLVRRAATLAGDLTLLLGGHRSKPTTFLTYSVHSTPPLRSRPALHSSCGRPSRCTGAPFPARPPGPVEVRWAGSLGRPADLARYLFPGSGDAVVRSPTLRDAPEATRHMPTRAKSLDLLTACIRVI